MAGTERAVFKVFIKGTVDAVWDEITRTDGVQPCMFNMRMHTTGLKPGAKMQMRTKSGRYAGVVGEVLEFDPKRRYAHTFKFTRYDDPPCRVIYELEPRDGGVEFTMILEDVPTGTKTAKDMIQGGTMIVNTLRSVVETGKPSLGIRLLYGLFGMLEPLSPARTKVENWPL